MNEEMNMLDAFCALKDLDESDLPRIRDPKKKVTEGKSFPLYDTTAVKEAEKMLAEKEVDDELEVIDVDADVVEHIKNSEDYLGQGILMCRKCRTNRFIDMDKLVPAEKEEFDDVFNLEDECPHCRSVGYGYLLIGQVGKVTKDELNEPEEQIENDQAPVEDEATFENDAELEDEEVDEEEVQPELEEVDEIEPEDIDGDETTVSEDDVELEAETAEQDKDKFEDDDDDSVKEALEADNVTNQKRADEAWMMNRVIEAMNDEEAYWGSWLYIWPDGETKEDCYYDFGEDEENFEDLKKSFERKYKTYHSEGLYNADPEVLEYAHKVDNRLGLLPIENLVDESCNKKVVRESLANDTLEDLLDKIITPENLNTIVLWNVAGNDSEMIYEGSLDDMPTKYRQAEFVSFDVGNGNLNINVDQGEEPVNPLRGILEDFNDDDNDNISLWDSLSEEEIFLGNKEQVIEHFGDVEFLSMDCPERLEVNIIVKNEDIEESKEKVSQTELESLQNKIFEVNKLASYRANNPKYEEYWIREALENKDDLKSIYEKYVKNTTKSLISEFKKVTGYKDLLDEAYEAMNESAPRNDDQNAAIEKAKQEVKDNDAFAVVYGYHGSDKHGGYDFYELDNHVICKNMSELNNATRDVMRTYKPAGSIHVIYSDNLDEELEQSVEESFEDVKEVNLFSNEELEKFENFVNKLHEKPQEEGEIELVSRELPQEEVKKLGGWPEYRLKIKEAIKIVSEEVKENLEEIYPSRNIQVDVESNYVRKKVNPEDNLSKSYIAGFEVKIKFDVLPEGELNFRHMLEEQPLYFEDLEVEVSEERGGEPVDGGGMSGDNIHYSPEYTAEGVVNNWTFTVEPSDEDLEKFIGKKMEEITQEDLDQVDLDAWYDFLLSRYRDAAIEDAALNWDSDPTAVEWKEFEEPEYEPEDYMESFKTRADLKEAIEERKNNNKPYYVKRSLKEGYRYDLYESAPEVIEIVDDQELQEALPINVPDDVEQVEGEVVDSTPVSNSTQVSDPRSQELVAKLMRISRDISQSIENHYNIRADERLILADIIQDLRLISGDLRPEQLANTPINNLTKEMYSAYDNFFNELGASQEQKVEIALAALDSDAFSPEVIDAQIGSQVFLKAARQGQVPYIQRNEIRALTTEALEEDLKLKWKWYLNEELKDANKLEAGIKSLVAIYVDDDISLNDKVACICKDLIEGCKESQEELPEAQEICELIKQELETDSEDVDNIVNSYFCKEEVCEQCGCRKEECHCHDEHCEDEDCEKEIDFSMFDKELMEYFDETYDDTVMYESVKGSYDKEGNMLVEGILTMNEENLSINFLFTKSTRMNESIEETYYIVTNNVSEEKFEFKF